MYDSLDDYLLIEILNILDWLFYRLVPWLFSGYVSLDLNYVMQPWFLNCKIEN